MSGPEPLDGVRVLEFAQLFPAPYAGLVLAELGAEVIKVEPPTGDPTRAVPPFVEDEAGGAGAIYCALNRGKRSVVLDLKDADDVARYKQLARTCRVVLDGYRTGVADRLGVGFETLAEDREDLVYVSLSGFGPEGPLAQEPGHDVTYQAWMGALDDEDPQLPNLPTADASGALWAALLAIAHLGQEGNHHVEASLAGSLSAATFMQNAMVAADGSGDQLRGALPGYNVYPCKEGKLLAIGALEPAFWDRLCKVIGDPELEQLGHPSDPEDEAHDVLAGRIASQPREAWLSALREAGVPCAPVRGVAEALEKPLTIASVDPPEVASSEDLAGAPELGEHTDEVLDRIG